MIRINSNDTICVRNGRLEAVVEGKKYVFEREQIEELVMITTDLGPFYDDMGLAVRINEETAFMIMSEHPVFQPFLFDELKTIVEIDYDAVIKAGTCVENGIFPIYKRAETGKIYQEKKIEETHVSEQDKAKKQAALEKEQAFYRKTYVREKKINYVLINITVVSMCVLCGGNFFKYLAQQERTAHDNEQMLVSAGGFIMFLALGWLNTMGGELLWSKYMAWVAGIKERMSRKERESITDLNTALHGMSQKTGVIVWDVLWGSGTFFNVVFLLMGGNTSVILGLLGFTLSMLLAGHYIGTRIWKRRRYEKRILKYTKKYLEILDEEAYIEDVNQSIQRGVLGYSGLWMLTDKYIIGRLSDIYFEVVAIPRHMIAHCVFFNYKKMISDTVPVGVLRCKLTSGQSVDFEIGRGDVCNQTLEILNEQGIPWKTEEMKFIN